MKSKVEHGRTSHLYSMWVDLRLVLIVPPWFTKSGEIKRSPPFELWKRLEESLVDHSQSYDLGRSKRSVVLIEDDGNNMVDVGIRYPISF